MLIETLQEIGLTDKEAKVYLKFLELGTQPTGVVCKSLNFPRSTVQFVAESLVKKGFLDKSIKNKVRHYTARSSETIKKDFEVQTTQFIQATKAKQQKLDLISTDILSIMNQKTRLPKILFYEGIDNVGRSYLEFIRQVKKDQLICEFVSPGSMPEGVEKKLRAFTDEFIRKRIENNIFCNVICSFGEDAARLKSDDQAFKRKTLISSAKTKDTFFSEFFISDDMTLSILISKNGVVSSLTIDRDAAKMHASLFQMAWDRAIKEDKKLCKKREIIKWLAKYKGEFSPAIIPELKDILSIVKDGKEDKNDIILTSDSFRIFKMPYDFVRFAASLEKEVSTSNTGFLGYLVHVRNKKEIEIDLFDDQQNLRKDRVSYCSVVKRNGSNSYYYSGHLYAFVEDFYSKRNTSRSFILFNNAKQIFNITGLGEDRQHQALLETIAVFYQYRYRPKYSNIDIASNLHQKIQSDLAKYHNVRHLFAEVSLQPHDERKAFGPNLRSLKRAIFSGLIPVGISINSKKDIFFLCYGSIDDKGNMVTVKGDLLLPESISKNIPNCIFTFKGLKVYLEEVINSIKAKE